MIEANKSARIYSRAEVVSDLTIHVLGIGFAAVASLWLLTHVSSATLLASVTVYCICLLAMIIASALYNLAPEGRLKDFFWRLDHSAIFLMIAGTYTPFAAHKVGATAGSVLLIAIWALAAIGIALKIFFPKRFDAFGIGLCLVMGWLIVTVVRPLSAHVAMLDLGLLLAGGLIYSAGVVFHVVERIPHHKAIWHAFVLVAAVLHYSAIVMEFAR
mgnify:FL=1